MASGHDPRKRRTIIAVLTARLPVVVAIMLAAGAALIAHWPALHAGALCFDDPEYLVQNPLVRNAGWASARTFLTEVLEPSTVHGYYQPLTMISLMLDCAAGGRPDYLLPFHRTSLILHAANAALIVLLLYLLLDSVPAAAMAGILFGVHPMWVETIAWVGERKTVLAAFFATLSLISYVWYARRRRDITAAGGRASKGTGIALLVLTALFYVLAMLSKPTSVPLPVCMVILDWWPLRRLSVRTVFEKVPLFALAAAFSWITYESQKRTAVAILPAGREVWQPLLIACHNTIFYLRQFIWPWTLSSHYIMPDPLNLSSRAVLVGVIGTPLLLGLLFLSLRRTRAAMAGWLYFFVAMFPTLGVIGFTSVIAADKYAYLPALGLLLPLAALLARLLKGGDLERSRARMAGVVAVCALAQLLLTVRSHAYLQAWSNTETLMKHMLRVTPDAFIVHDYLAYDLAQRGRIDEAIEHYRRGIELNPGYAATYKELGVLLDEHGRTPEAVRLLDTAVRLRPDFPEAWNALANIAFREGRIEQAHAWYLKAIGMRPGYADAHYNLANLFTRAARFDDAVTHFHNAIAAQPAHFAAHKNLGTVYLQMGRTTDAVREYREALKYRADWPVMNALAWLLATSPEPALRNPAEGVELAQRAAKETGGTNPTVLATLAVALAEAGAKDAAQATAARALKAADALGQQRLAEELRERMGKYGLAPFTRPAGGDNPP